MRKTFRSFEEARYFVRNLSLSSCKQWNEYSKSTNRPSDIPSNPEKAYADKGWNGYADWLGTNNKSWKQRSSGFYAFETARTFVQKLNLKTRADWYKYCSDPTKPDYIPSNPNVAYKDSGWVSFADWLGTNKLSNFDISANFLPYDKAQAIVSSANFKSMAAYRKWPNRPAYLPSNPNKAYRGKGWINGSHWLGKQLIRSYQIHNQFLPIEEARIFMANLKMNCVDDFWEWCSAGLKPDNIPSNPHRTYKDSGWINYADFLGYDPKLPYGERVIISWLKSKNITFQHQQKMPGCRLKNTLRFDFGIYDDDWLIALLEYNGKQHEKPIKYFGGIQEYSYQQKRDAIKADYCAINNIPLLTIRYGSTKQIYQDLDQIYLALFPISP